MARGATAKAGATVVENGIDFAVWSRNARKIDLCLFDEAGAEIVRDAMRRGDDDMHRLFVEGATEGTRYGLRAHGTYAPDQGLWFDPSKLLIDPYATELDSAFRHDPRLAVLGEDTAALVPKAIVRHPIDAASRKPVFAKGGFIYELSVRAFTMLHPDVPEHQRGTIAALGHPAVLHHLKSIGVDAVELMPIVAWIDERHLPPLGLSNAWGYNPIALMALDPRLAPGGMAELRDTVAQLHAEGIGVILDLVFNHTGESDRHGATLSMRGLDNLAYYRHAPERPGDLINDTGTGNTLACDHPQVRDLILDSLRHFVLRAGIDGFRFDLATIIGRTATGFERDGDVLTAIANDDVLADRVMIAEPWDIGPGGYQLGNFPTSFLEWNDRPRDNLRRYWRGDGGMTGALATALAGSSDVFTRHNETETRSVNFLAAHDGFTLMDVVSYSGKHNEANGENNQDGHNENHSWNNGVEGEPAPTDVVARRTTDVKALLATLFASRGHVMLTAGDEAGRTQRGNNNAYCQDNALTWLDWTRLDPDLIAYTTFLSGLRKRFSALSATTFFAGNGDVTWLAPSGEPMSIGEWEAQDQPGMVMVMDSKDRTKGGTSRLAVTFNRSWAVRDIHLPWPQEGRSWCLLHQDGEDRSERHHQLAARSVAFFLESYT